MFWFLVPKNRLNQMQPVLSGSVACCLTMLSLVLEIAGKNPVLTETKVVWYHGNKTFSVREL